MIFFSVCFALVLFSGSEARLPDVGSCTFMEYYCDTLKCYSGFIKRLQKDPNGDCSDKFTGFVKCVTESTQICTDRQLSDSTVSGIVRQNYKENSYCLDGALEIPTAAPHSISSPCSASFNSDATDCIRTFHQKFAADKSDPSLCQEHANAKQCLKKLINSECTFPSAAKEVLDLGFSNYNPFCDNNRDPGTAGTQCDDVRNLENKYNAAAGLKSSVVQALLFAFASVLFFVKF